MLLGMLAILTFIPPNDTLALPKAWCRLDIDAALRNLASVRSVTARVVTAWVGAGCVLSEWRTLFAAGSVILWFFSRLFLKRCGCLAQPPIFSRLRRVTRPVRPVEHVCTCAISK